MLESRRILIPLGAALGLAAFAALWLMIAWAYGQEPAGLRARDLYPFLSGASLFASGGALAGSLAARGRGRVALGIAGGAAAAFVPAGFLVLHPYALPFAIPAVGVVAGGALVGAGAGLVAHLVRGPRTAALGTRR